MARTITSTEKVPTKFGAFYTHVEYTIDGDIVGVWVSTSQRHESTDIEMLAQSLAGSLHDQIRAVYE